MDPGDNIKRLNLKPSVSKEKFKIYTGSSSPSSRSFELDAALFKEAVFALR